MPDLALIDGQIDLGGVLLGPDTVINLIDVTGLGRPPVRDNDVDQPSMDGSWAGPDYWGSRQVQIDAAIRTPGDREACEAMLATLLQAYADPATRLTGGEGLMLRIKRPGRPIKRLTGRVRKIDPQYAQVIHGYMPLDIEFIAQDPVWYGDTVSVTDIPLGWLTGGGFAAPVVAPIFVQDGAVAADRPGWAHNDGTADAWPVIRISGPCATVTITHAESGRQLSFPTLNLDAGQWIDIDTRPGYRTITRENGGNASTLMSPSSRIDLFSLPPGQSEMRWTAFDNTNTARMRLTWRNAYNAL